MKRVASVLVAIGCAGTAFAGGQINIIGGPFHNANGGEWRIQVLSGDAGERGLYSDIDGTITGDNAGTFKVTTDVAGQFFTQYSMGATAGQIASSNAARAVDDFQSFCIERGEGLQGGPTYWYTIEDFAVRGLNGDTPVFQDYVTPHGTLVNVRTDYVDVETKWLYYNFRHGTLPGFNFWGVSEAQREASAASLQAAIWYFEEGSAVLPADAQAQAWIAAANIATVNGTDTTGVWNRVVKAMNTYLLNGAGQLDIDGLRQSQLTLIPLPTTGVLAFAGLCGLAIRRRR